jgi:hypothetical protein
VTAPVRARRDANWFTFGVLFAAAMSLALVVDQALIVAAGRHLAARVDGWLAGLQPEPAPTARGPLVDVDAVRRYAEERSAEERSTTGAGGAAASETPSDTDPESPAT